MQDAAVRRQEARPRLAQLTDAGLKLSDFLSTRTRANRKDYVRFLDRGVSAGQCSPRRGPMHSVAVALTLLGAASFRGGLAGWDGPGPRTLPFSIRCTTSRRTCLLS